MACLSFFVYLKQKVQQFLPVIIVLSSGLNSSPCMLLCSDEGFELLIFMLVAAWPSDHLARFIQESNYMKVGFVKPTNGRHCFLNLYLTKLLICPYQLPLLILTKDSFKLHISGFKGLVQLLNVFRGRIEHNPFLFQRSGLLLN